MRKWNRQTYSLKKTAITANCAFFYVSIFFKVRKLEENKGMER
jgi:hypothetical protein